MSLSELRFGIVGCGLIADWHARAINETEGAVLAGVTDSRPAAAVDFAAKHSAIVYDSFEYMLKQKDIDIVCLCTPSGLHAPYAVMAAQAGKHVILEKPMALTLTQADDVINACISTGVKMQIISQLRFTDAVTELIGAIRNGWIGRVVTGDIYMKYYRSQEYYDRSGWRGTIAMDGGGALMNQGIHGVDLLRYVMGPVRSVSGIVRTLARKIEAEDTACAVLEFTSGALGMIEATTSVFPGYPRRMEICGDKGCIILTEDRIVRWDVEGHECPVNIDKASGVLTANDPAALSCEGHIFLFRDMADAVRNNRETLVGPREGKKPLEIISAIYRSSKTGMPVYLSENKD
jgi:UDP-N-acetyl-2-amino-2-deoxyglucuronate dehydrogenase